MRKIQCATHVAYFAILKHKFWMYKWSIIVIVQSIMYNWDLLCFLYSWRGTHCVSCEANAVRAKCFRGTEINLYFSVYKPESINSKSVGLLHSVHNSWQWVNLPIGNSTYIVYFMDFVNFQFLKKMIVIFHS